MAAKDPNYIFVVLACHLAFHSLLPPRQKFLHVNQTKSCFAFLDLPSARIFLPPCKQPLSVMFIVYSLVNVDTKIMTKVIATRIKNVLPDIIHCDKTGYVKDRFIRETIRSFTAKENIPGLLVFIDVKKAFDSVEWNFLYRCLEIFNFGPDFIHWVKTFYKNIQSCTINNGMA